MNSFGQELNSETIGETFLKHELWPEMNIKVYFWWLFALKNRILRLICREKSRRSTLTGFSRKIWACMQIEYWLSNNKKLIRKRLGQHTQWTKLFLVKLDNIWTFKCWHATAMQVEKAKVRHKSKLDSMIVGQKSRKIFVNVRVLWIRIFRLKAFRTKYPHTYFSEALKVAKKRPKIFWKDESW